MWWRLQTFQLQPRNPCKPVLPTRDDHCLLWRHQDPTDPFYHERKGNLISSVCLHQRLPLFSSHITCHEFRVQNIPGTSKTQSWVLPASEFGSRLLDILTSWSQTKNSKILEFLILSRQEIPSYKGIDELRSLGKQVKDQWKGKTTDSGLESTSETISYPMDTKSEKPSSLFCPPSLHSALQELPFLPSPTTRPLELLITLDPLPLTKAFPSKQVQILSNYNMLYNY